MVPSTSSVIVTQIWWRAFIVLENRIKMDKSVSFYKDISEVFFWDWAFWKADELGCSERMEIEVGKC